VMANLVKVRAINGARVVIDNCVLKKNAYSGVQAMDVWGGS
jgi:hypothetical protein